MKQIIWYLIAGTRGGETRARIIKVVKKTPMNANQLTKTLKLDYKTIQHHLKILVDNHIFHVVNKGKYGAVYFLSSGMEENLKELGSIWERFGQK